jgi:Putative beta-barrel porin 2
MPRLIPDSSLGIIPKPYQESLGTVSKRLLTVLLACLFASLYIPTARSEVVISGGLSGGDEVLPFIGVRVDKSWTVAAWKMSMLGEGRAEKQHGLGDALVKIEWHAETGLSQQTELELDADYAFDRDRGEAVKQFHTLGADIGLEHRFDGLTLKSDVGVESQLFEDTTQKGFRPLDRSHEDLLDTEAALRLTFLNTAQFRPFVEAAYVRRDYLLQPDRGYVGPELIGGVTFSGFNLTGDAGLILLLRTANDGTQRHLVGPYVDLKWHVQPGSEVSLGLGAGLDQDTSGPAELFSRYSGRLEILQDVTSNLKLSFVMDAIHENRAEAWERELTPTLTLTRSSGQGTSLYGAAGLTLNKIEGLPSTTDPNFEVGMKWTW